ncbi:hypothetical protein LVJ83_00410 [Uruburuella testudinis]|uniref:Uncharacterized protein n=1 Tax=Uruburuella testudinis TaxID=1282863 RepID=A0ABY4DSF8_9NEIS|nr:hypothetical protein [Uruburuella testudinis]UOO81976.1 hypothetical protein LVJ83_00410 [Uruburuella testudinis]
MAAAVAKKSFIVKQSADMAANIVHHLVAPEIFTAAAYHAPCQPKLSGAHNTGRLKDCLAYYNLSDGLGIVMINHRQIMEFLIQNILL